MSEQYSSNTFNRFQKMNDSIEKQYDKIKSLAEEGTAPTKKYVEDVKTISSSELKDAYAHFIKINKAALEANTTLAKEWIEKGRQNTKDTYNTTKEEIEKTTGDIKSAYKKTAESIKTRAQQNADTMRDNVKSAPAKIEESFNVVKTAANDIRHTVIGGSTEKKVTPKKSSAKKSAAKTPSAKREEKAA